MLKVVACIVTTTLIFFTIILNPSIPRQMFECLNHDTSVTSHVDGYKIRRLGLTQPIIFDPLVSNIRRMSEEERREARQRRAILVAEGNELIYEEARINTRLRLMVLFPTIDIAPKDDIVDYHELEAWIVQQAIDSMNYRTQLKLDELDKDGDALISFSECVPQFTHEDIDKNINNTGHGEVGWWFEQFRNADFDHSGTLNLYEFRDFLHPEDCRNEHIQRWVINQKIRHWDVDGDQQLNLYEFVNGAYGSYKSYFQYETGKEAQSSDSIFFKLDINQDRLLRAEELKPIVQYLNPGELTYAKHYARYLINEADEDGDGKLTLNEMLNHASVFYNTVYNSEMHENAEDSYHDEL